MSDTDRVQRWRQRMRDEGKEPITIWLSHDEKLRLEDLARTWRSTNSEIVEQALAQFRPGNPDVTAIVPDTVQLRVLMQEALLETTAVTELVTDMVTATLARDLPALVREATQDIVDTPAVSSSTDTNSNVSVTQSPESSHRATPPQAHEPAPAPRLGTEPAPARKGGRPRSALGQRILALLADHPEGLTAEQLRGYLNPDKPIGDTLAGMRRLGTVRTAGQGKALRYFAAR